MLKSIIMQKYTLIFILLFFTLFTHAQERRFMGGAVIGLNAAQIDGDNAAGFNKAGLVAGIRGGAFLTDRSMVTLDMLYSVRGSHRAPRKGEAFFETFDITTTYIEVPLLYHFKDWLVEYDDGSQFYKVSIETGPVISSLLNATAQNTQYSVETDNFAKLDLGWSFGVSYYFNEHIGVTGRYHRSINLLYNNKNYNQNLNKLRAYHFNFSLFYVL